MVQLKPCLFSFEPLCVRTVYLPSTIPALIHKNQSKKRKVLKPSEVPIVSSQGRRKGREVNAILWWPSEVESTYIFQSTLRGLDQTLVGSPHQPSPWRCDASPNDCPTVA